MLERKTIIRSIWVSEVAYCRWRQKFGGLRSVLQYHLLAFFIIDGFCVDYFGRSNPPEWPRLLTSSATLLTFRT